MKKFTIVAGIDVSKLKLDVSIVTDPSSKKFNHFIVDNNRKGISEIFKVIEKMGLKMEEVLFCFEHTGVYAMHLCYELQKRQYAYSMIPAIEIKRSRGLVRGKSDKADSKEIALYAFTHAHKLSISALPELSIAKLKLLMVEKEKLKKAILILKTTDENIGYLPKELLKETISINHKTIVGLQNKKKEIEKMIEELVKSDEKIKGNFTLVCSVPGVGKEIAVNLIMYTRNFTGFDNWRKLACYAGMAPFEYSSGSSVRGRTKVSPIANKKLKSILTLGVLAAIKHDQQIKTYYQRKVKEGKNKMLVINAIRCKIISRVFAVVNRNSPFVDTYKFAA